jgi:hypothetical protein
MERPMNNDEFQAKVTKALAEQHSALRRLWCYNQCVQALSLALAEQQGLDLQQLEGDYEDNLQRAQEQTQPHLQDREIYEGFAKSLQDRLQRRTG